jgi:hypothetical protein
MFVNPNAPDVMSVVGDVKVGGCFLPLPLLPTDIAGSLKLRAAESTSINTIYIAMALKLRVTMQLDNNQGVLMSSTHRSLLLEVSQPLPIHLKRHQLTSCQLF